MLRHVFDGILDCGWLKLSLALLFSAFHWVFGNENQQLIAVFALVGIDTITGFAKAWRGCEVSSRGFFRVPVKFSVYLLLLVTGRLVDKALVDLPLSSFLTAYTIIASFLAITEAISIMENLGQMGFAVPSTLVKKLKALQGDQQQK